MPTNIDMEALRQLREQAEELERQERLRQLEQAHREMSANIFPSGNIPQEDMSGRYYVSSGEWAVPSTSGTSYTVSVGATGGGGVSASNNTTAGAAAGQIQYRPLRINWDIHHMVPEEIEEIDFSLGLKKK